MTHQSNNEESQIGIRPTAPEPTKQTKQWCPTTLSTDLEALNRLSDDELLTLLYAVAMDEIVMTIMLARAIDYRLMSLSSNA